MNLAIGSILSCRSAIAKRTLLRPRSIRERMISRRNPDRLAESPPAFVLAQYAAMISLTATDVHLTRKVINRQSYMSSDNTTTAIDPIRLRNAFGSFVTGV